jgi:hypothetical protein
MSEFMAIPDVGDLIGGGQEVGGIEGRGLHIRVTRFSISIWEMPVSILSSLIS